MEAFLGTNRPSCWPDIQLSYMLLIKAYFGIACSISECNFKSKRRFFETLNLRFARRACFKILQDVSRAAFKYAFKAFRSALEKGMFHA